MVEFRLVGRVGQMGFAGRCRLCYKRVYARLARLDTGNDETTFETWTE